MEVQQPLPHRQAAPNRAASLQQKALPAQEVTPTTITYPLQASEKLTFGMVLAPEWSDRFNSWTDLPIGKAIQKETGVELEMVQVENNTAMNLLFASGELPDIVLFNFQGNYSGGEIKAIEDGTFILWVLNFYRKMHRITGQC